MNENTNTVDTPQEAFTAPVEQQSQQGSIVDEVIFGTKQPEDMTYTNTEEQAVPQEGIPAQEPQMQPQQEPQLDNEQVRYQYWQSQADRRGNEAEELKKTNEMLQNQVNTLIERGGNPQAQQEAPPEEQFEFPAPPDKPQKPSRFNREEAYSDPDSESARYLDTADQWRDDMDEYNRLRGEYDREIMANERQAMVDEQNRVKEAQQQQARQREQVGGIKQHLNKTYGANDETINDFLKTMSSPESLTVDNLWKLYALEKGASSNPAAPAPAQQQPSAAFEQTQRAQQIPSPMGVVSGVNRQTDKTANDRIMDELIGDFNKQNPW